MSGFTIKNIHDTIEAAAFSHPSVKEFGSGERHAISPGGGAKTVNVWLEQPFFVTTSFPTRGNPTRTHRIQILVLDIALEDREDELDIISRCDMIAMWIVLSLRANESLGIISPDVNCLSLTQYGGDLWAGVRLEFEVTTGMPINACDVENV